jgi:hypothetical protein
MEVMAPSFTLLPAAAGQVEAPSHSDSLGAMDSLPLQPLSQPMPTTPAARQVAASPDPAAAPAFSPPMGLDSGPSMALQRTPSGGMLAEALPGGAVEGGSPPEALPGGAVEGGSPPLSSPPQQEPQETMPQASSPPMPSPPQLPPTPPSRAHPSVADMTFSLASPTFSSPAPPAPAPTGSAGLEGAGTPSEAAAATPASAPHSLPAATPSPLPEAPQQGALVMSPPKQTWPSDLPLTAPIGSSPVVLSPSTAPGPLLALAPQTPMAEAGAGAGAEAAAATPASPAANAAATPASAQPASEAAPSPFASPTFIS